MPAATTRRQARQRLSNVLKLVLDKLIPEDEAIAMKGKTFADFEDLAESQGRPIVACLMEELAALSQDAATEGDGGRCPHCGSRRVEPVGKCNSEYYSRCGPVVVKIEKFFCRSCRRRFSPSGS